MKEVKQKYQNTLQSVRNKSKNLSDFNCEIENQDEYPVDKNEIERFRLSVAIYNDFKKEDEFIIEHLIHEQLSAMKKANLFISDSYHLLGHLYTKNKNPRKVETLYELKVINYDTFCGFDREHLFANGIRETYDYLDTIETEYANKIKKEMGQTYEEALFKEKDIKNWETYKNEYFTPLQYPTSLKSKVDFFLQTKENELLDKTLDEWYNTTNDWNQSNLNYLMSCLRQLNNHTKTIEFLETKSKLFNGESTNQILINQIVNSYLNNHQEIKATRLVESKIGFGKNDFYENNLINQLFKIREQTLDKYLKTEIEQIIENRKPELKFSNGNETNYNKMKNDM